MKRTPWYPASIKPVNGTWSAMYEVRCLSPRTGWRKPVRWSKMVLHGRCPCPHCQWRGLAEKPEEA